MRVSMMQFKPALGHVDENFERVERLMVRAMVEQPDVLVLPELWSTGYYPTPVKEYADDEGRRSKAFLIESARRLRVNIVGGTAIVSDGGRIFNRSYAVDRNGAIRAEYDKIHLFSPAGEEKVFASGDRLVSFELDGVKCSIAVCYDIRFPEMIRRLALDGVEVMFVPAAWPKKRAEHWRILNRARAIENQMFVAAVNSGGYSTAIEPWGEVLIEGDIDEAVLTVELNLETKKTIGSMMNVFADRNETIDHV